MVVGRPAYRAPLRRQEGTYQRPLLVSEVCLFWRNRDRLGYRVGVLVGGVQQALDALRVSLPDGLGDLPAVVAQE